MRKHLFIPALLTAAVLAIVPSAARAQKALVYCPTDDDATCATLVGTLTSTGVYPQGVDRGYDGTGGTVDLRSADLLPYSVFFVPSLSDNADGSPYALLRDATVSARLRDALLGRRAFWSGTPDLGSENRDKKNALITSLAVWAGANYATSRGPAIVALQDGSENEARQYDWAQALTGLRITSDPSPATYASVRTLTATGASILSNAGTPLAYTNMASYGFYFPNGAPGVSMDAVGQTGTSVGGQVLLVTAEGVNASAAWVKTDKNDYAPGEFVTITGAGFQAGEAITIALHEDPLVHHDRTLSATADADGRFVNTSFAPEDHDLFVRFVLTATGSASGRRAQTTFTDGPVGVVAATGGTLISADQAANATGPQFTTLGSISIGEQAAGDFPIGSNTLVLSPPSGWTFKAGVGSVATTKSGAGGNELSASVSVTSTAITIVLNVTATGQINSLTVSGIQVQAVDGANTLAAANIVRTGGTANISGANVADNANFGTLSQVPGAVRKLVVTLPGQTFTDATTLAASGNAGSVQSQTAGVQFAISRLTATDQFFNVVTAYSGAKTIGYSGPTITTLAPTYTTAVSFTNGVSMTPLATTLMKAETATITAADGTISGPASSNVTINVGALNAFAVTSTAGTAIATQAAGTPFDVQVVALDVGGNTYTAFDGGSNKVTITSTGTLSAGAGVTGAFTAGVLSPLTVTVANAGTVTITATRNQGGTQSGTSNAFTVTAPPCTAPVATVAQPSVTVTAGQPASIASSATGTATIGYQWYKGTAPSGTAVAGQSAATLQIASATPADAGAYYVITTNACGSATASATLTVNQIATSVAGVAATTSTYGGTTTLTATVSPATAGSVTFFVNGSATAAAGTVTYDAATGAASLTAYTHGLTPSVTAYAVKAVFTPSNISYAGSQQTTTAALTVNKSNQTITFAALAAKTFGDAAFPVSATATSALAVTFTAGATDKCTVSGGTVTLTGAGSCTITAAQAGDANYNAATSVPQTFTIGKATPAFSFSLASLPAKSFGDPAFSVVGGGMAFVSSNSTGAITFATGAGSVGCNVTTAGTVTITGATGAGQSCIIAASLATDANYNAAGPLSQQFGIARVAQAALTVTGVPTTEQAFGASFSVGTTGGSTSGAVSYTPAGACTVAGNTVTMSAGTGSCSVTATMAGNANYQDVTSAAASVTARKAAATINVTGFTGTYDGAAHGATGTATGVNGENLNGLLSLGASYTNVPGGSATWSFAGNGNYEARSDAASIAITQAGSTVTLTCPTTPQPYTGAAQTPCSAVAAGAGVVTGTPTLTYAGNTGVGTATVQASYAGDVNHTGSTASGSFTIAKADQATAVVVSAPASMTFGQAAATLSAAGGNGSGAYGFSAGGSTGCSVTGNQLTVSNASGTCAVTASRAGDDFYNASAASPPVSVALVKATAAINVTGYTGTYDGTAHGATGTATGINGANLAAQLDLGASFTNAPGGSATWSFAGGNNYNGASGSVAITINQAAGAIGITGPASLAYGQTSAIGTTRAGDGSVTYAATAGGGTVCSVNGSTGGVTMLSGTGTCTLQATLTAGTNYTGAASNALSINATKATATLDVTGYTGTYDGAAHGATGTAAGINGENLNGLLNLGASYTNVPGGSAAWSFAGGSNYNDANGSAAIVIGKAGQTAVQVSAPASMTFGQAAVTLTASGGSGTGAYTFSIGASTGCSLAGDQLTVSNASNGCAVTASRNGDGNYNASAASAPATVTLNKATATLALDAATLAQTYNGSARVVMATTGPAGLTGVSITYDGSSTAPTGAGSYAVVASLANANYSASNAQGTLVVDKANGSVTIANIPGGAVFGGSFTPAYTTSGDGIASVVSVTPGVCSVGGTGAVSFAASGNCQLQASVAAGTNHKAASGAAQSFVIAKANQTTAVVVSAPASMTFGQTAATLTATGGNGTGAYTFGAGTSTGCSVTGNQLSVTNASNGCTVTASRSGDGNYNASAASAPATVTLNKAAATVTYTGPVTISGLAGKNGSGFSATITSSATVQIPVGTISSDMQIVFSADNGGTGCTARVGSIGGDGKTGTASCTWSASSNTDQGVAYNVLTTLAANNFTGSDNEVVNASAGGTSFITGGGFLLLNASAGTWAGTAGTKNSFGFNVKYNKSGTNLQGNVNIIFRRMQNGVMHVYQVKGNAMTQLSSTLSAAGGKATFNGKASMQDITNPLAPVSLGGNLALQLDVTDNGEPGSTDTVAITVMDGGNGGLLFSSQWNGVNSAEQVLKGGNTQVR